MLGQRLTESRRKRKLSQEKAAEKLNIPRSTLSNYEAGNRRPDHEMLKKFAEFYSVTIDYLLGRTDDPEAALSERANQLLDIIDLTDEEILNNVDFEIDGKKLTDEERMRFVAFVRAERNMRNSLN